MKILRIVSCLSIALGAVGPLAPVIPGKAATLADELRQYYKPIKAEVLLAGTARPTLLLVRQAGLPRVAAADAPFLERCPSVFRSGQLRPSNDFFCSHLASEPEKTLKLNEKVYATDIAVNAKADNVRLRLATCNFCDAAQPVSFQSLVVIEFSKGSLANAKADIVIQAIDQVVAAEKPPGNKTTEKVAPVAVQPAASSETTAAKSGDGETLAPSRAPSATAPAAAAAQAPATTSQPAPVSTVLREGQTPEEVEQAMGKPQRTYDMGPRKIYIYTDVKVTFVDGKLTGIE